MTPKSRLDQVTTIPGEQPGDRVLRYQHAIRNRLRQYLPPDEAEAVFSDIVVKICEGKFDAWDPAEGRFHHYLARSIHNAVRDYFRRKNRQDHRRVPLSEDRATHTDPDDVAAAFGVEVVHEVLRQLRRYQRIRNLGRKAGGRWGPNAYYTILRLRMKHPRLANEELVARLPWRFQQWFRSKPAAFRKQLQHARELFAALLVIEVATPYQDIRAGLPKHIGPELVRAVGRKLRDQEWLRELLCDLNLWTLVKTLCPGPPQPNGGSHEPG